MTGEATVRLAGTCHDLKNNRRVELDIRRGRIT